MKGEDDLPVGKIAKKGWWVCWKPFRAAPLVGVRLLVSQHMTKVIPE